jgi:hypothetical protein
MARATALASIRWQELNQVLVSSKTKASAARACQGRLIRATDPTWESLRWKSMN